MDKTLGKVSRFPGAGAGDEFFTRLCRAHESQLLGYLTKMLGRGDLAQEVAQDAYEKLHRMYRPQELLFPRAMLFKVATNLALMHLRRRRLESSMFSGPEGMDEVPDHGLGPERMVLAEQLGRRLVQVIKALPPSLRRVFVMAQVEGRPRKEIAETLGISEKRLDKRMTKALKRCRMQLSSQGIDLAEVD